MLISTAALTDYYLWGMRSLETELDGNGLKKGIRKFVRQVAMFSQLLQNAHVLVLAVSQLCCMVAVIGTTLINVEEKLWRASIERAQNKFQRCPSFPFSLGCLLHNYPAVYQSINATVVGLGLNQRAN